MLKFLRLTWANLGLAWPLLEQDHEFYNPNSTKKSNNQENLRVSSFLSQNQEILP